LESKDYEEAVIAAAFQGDANVLSALSAELAPDRFTGPRRKVYEAILDAFISDGQVNILNVAREIGPELSGKETKTELAVYQRALERLGIESLNGLPQWVRFVDDVGRLRQAQLVFHGNAKKLEDLNRAMSDIDDVDKYLAEIHAELWRIESKSGRAGYKPIADLVEMWLKRVLMGKGMTEFVPSGFPAWDETILGLPVGLTVLCGLPSMGKTQLALELAKRRAQEVMRQKRDAVVLFNSIEMAADKLITRLACSEAKVDSRKLRIGQLSDSEKKRLDTAIANLRKLPILVDDSDFVTSDMLTMQALAYSGRDIAMLAIDFAELVRDELVESEELRVSGIYRNAKAIAKDLAIPVVLLAQYNRSVSQRNSKLGDNDSIRYSGMAAIAADCILHIYSPWQLELQHREVQPPHDLPAKENMAYIICGKNREGPAGTFELMWNPTWTRWADLSEEDRLSQIMGDF
jgi:replicative DNA helicase